MRNIYHIFLLLLFILIPCTSSHAQSGTVLKFTEKLDSVVAPDNKLIYEYDNRGYVIKYSTYSFDTQKQEYILSEMSEYERNNQGLPTKDTFYSRNYETGEMESSGTSMCVYDEDGRKVEDALYRNGTIVYCYNYSYDGDIRTTIYHRYSNNVCTEFTTRVVDTTLYNFPLKVESFNYDDNGQITYGSKSEYTYDEKGSIIHSISYVWRNNTWITSEETITDIDAFGNTIKQCNYNLIDGELRLHSESFYEYNENILKKEIHYDYRYENGTRIIDSEWFKEYDSRGNILEDNNVKYERKFDRYGDLTEATIYYKCENGLQSWNKVECSYDADGNLIIMFYGHFKNGLTWINPTMGSLPWYSLEKHVIGLDANNEIKSVKVYEMVDENWTIACEGIYHKGITVADYLGDYPGLNHAYTIEYGSQNSHFNCLKDAIKLVCYDRNGNVIFTGGNNYSFENEYGGNTNYSKLKGGVRRTIYNEFNEILSQETEKFINGEWQVTSWLSTDEYYSDYTPIVQTTYNNGKLTNKVIYTYDWDVNVNTIAGSSQRHKLLSKEVIGEDDSSLFTRYYYSKLGSANQYTITFDTDGGSEINPITQAYGSAVTAPANPTKPGYTFAGWDKDIPATMPAENMVIKAIWTINKYKLVYMVDGAMYNESEVEYNATITPLSYPTKDGYTFSGWSEIPEIMPDHDVVVTGSFTINQYTITFDTDGGSAISPITQAYGSAVTAPVNPTKTGYTFAGWDKEIPATMPAENVTIKALWTVNSYKLTYMVDDQLYVESTVTFGDPITPEPALTKEGYTFSGWSEIPTTMPAHDVVITGSFTVNKYKVTFVVDGTVVKEDNLDYGSPITVPNDPVKDGYTFTGWSPNVDSTVPAHDVTYTAQFEVASGVAEIEHDSAPVKIYTLGGAMQKSNATPSDYKSLKKGIYIINGKKVVVK